MRRYSHLSLPGHRHVPGSGSTPDMAPLAAGKAGRQAFAYGVDLFNRGCFWEAHEVWEAVWVAAAPNSARRQGLKALIQMANAGLKLTMGRRGAFHRLAREVAQLVPGADLSPEGLDLATLAAAFQRFAEAARGDETVPDPPVIALRHAQASSGETSR